MPPGVTFAPFTVFVYPPPPPDPAYTPLPVPPPPPPPTANISALVYPKGTPYDCEAVNVLLISVPVLHVAFLTAPVITPPPHCDVGITAKIIGGIQRRHIKVSLRPCPGCRVVPGPFVDLCPSGGPGVTAGGVSDDHTAEWFPRRLIRVLPFRQYPAA